MSDNCQENDVSPPVCKKIKFTNENESTVNEHQVELKDFVVEKILNNNTNRKTVCVVGKFKNKSGVALISFEKNAFKEEELSESEDGYFSSETNLRTFFQNDIYGNFECFPRQALNGDYFQFFIAKVTTY